LIRPWTSTKNGHIGTPFAPWHQCQIAPLMCRACHHNSKKKKKNATYVVDAKLGEVTLQIAHAVHHVGLHRCCERLPIRSRETTIKLDISRIFLELMTLTWRSRRLSLPLQHRTYAAHLHTYFLHSILRSVKDYSAVLVSWNGHGCSSFA